MSVMTLAFPVRNMGSPSKTTYFDDPEHIPTESVPDNFVSYTLKHQEELPPITWNNLHKEVNWLHVTILFIPPILFVIGALHTRLRWNTAVWTIVYGLMPSLGKSDHYDLCVTSP